MTQPQCLTKLDGEPLLVAPLSRPLAPHFPRPALAKLWLSGGHLLVLPATLSLFCTDFRHDGRLSARWADRTCRHQIDVDGTPEGAAGQAVDHVLLVCFWLLAQNRSNNWLWFVKRAGTLVSALVGPGSKSAWG